MLAESRKPSVSYHHDGLGHSYVRVRGEIDVANADELAAALDAALRGCPTRLVIDLSEVTFIDGAAISRIVHARRAIPVDACPIVIRNPKPIVVRLFGILGLDGVCEIEHDPDEENEHPS